MLKFWLIFKVRLLIGENMKSDLLICAKQMRVEFPFLMQALEMKTNGQLIDSVHATVATGKCDFQKMSTSHRAQCRFVLVTLYIYLITVVNVCDHCFHFPKLLSEQPHKSQLRCIIVLGTWGHTSNRSSRETKAGGLPRVPGQTPGTIRPHLKTTKMKIQKVLWAM